MSQEYKPAGLRPEYSKYGTIEKSKLIALLGKGITIGEIAERFKTTRMTIYKSIRYHNINRKFQ